MFIYAEMYIIRMCVYLICVCVYMPRVKEPAVLAIYVGGWVGYTVSPVETTLWEGI